MCSPHVTCLRERIAVDGEPITEAAFDKLVQEQEHALEMAEGDEQGLLSHFEVVTALAYRHFQEAKVCPCCLGEDILCLLPQRVVWMAQEILGLQVDIAVVETGLGGVRDATNVFPPDTLKLAVITAIGLEHQKALGNSLREIVAAKAGACKLTAPRVSLCPLRGHALTQIECFGGYLWTTAK